MTEGFLWGGINFRKLCRFFFGNFWMVIAVMIITYLGLGLVDQQTYTPRYTSTAIAAVYPITSSYRYHTIETVQDLSSKTDEVSSVFNNELFQSTLHNQDPSLRDCAIDSTHIQNTDLLVIHATSYNPENALKGISAALNYFSQFSGKMTGASEIKIILGPEAPYLTGSSKIQNYRLRLCILSGLIMAGLLLFMYIARKTYKTERNLRRRYEEVRFFSLPFIRSGSENKKRILLKKNRPEPIKKLAVEIKQALHKFNKQSLFVTSFADKAGGTAILSALAIELANQNEKVILIGTEGFPLNDALGTDSTDGTKKNTLLDILQRKCTVKDAMIYSEELKVYYIPYGLDSIDEDILYSVEGVRRVLIDCLEHADLVLVNGAAWYPSHVAQIWQEATDTVVALCRQDDADLFKVDKMLSDLQKGDTYFAGCVLFGF